MQVAAGLGSRDVRAGDFLAMCKNMRNAINGNDFKEYASVGIIHETALVADQDPDIRHPEAFSMRGHSIGGYGSVTTNKVIADLMSDLFGLYVQAYPKYGSSKKGLPTTYYLTLAPEHVRNFLRLASVGVFDGMSFHRVVDGMLIQSGWLGSRNRPLDERQRRLVTTLEPEFSATPHVRGTVSMARGDDPASADTSFFICTDTVSTLDGEYTVFARVVDGMENVDAIESLPLEGETPLQRVEILGVQIAR